MDQDDFWHIVEEARAEMGSDSERVAQALLRRLRALKPEDIEQFQEQWDRAQGELDRWSISHAATLLLGPINDMLAVQGWLISHGRETVRCVQDDPDSLVSLAPDRHNAKMDWFCGLPMEAHIGATGAPIAVDGPPGPDEPYGTPVDLRDEATARRHFPRLTAYLDDNPWIPRPWAHPDN